MKKILQVSVIVILALVLVLTAFTFRGSSPEMAGGKICPMVGWNTSPYKCSPVTKQEAIEGLALKYQLPPEFTPCVGWNT